eukprot:1521315-Rhodomonas_salina.2
MQHVERTTARDARNMTRPNRSTSITEDCLQSTHVKVRCTASKRVAHDSVWYPLFIAHNTHTRSRLCLRRTETSSGYMACMRAICFSVICTGSTCTVTLRSKCHKCSSISGGIPILRKSGSLSVTKMYLFGQACAARTFSNWQGLCFANVVTVLRHTDEIVDAGKGGVTVLYAREQRSNRVCAHVSSLRKTRIIPGLSCGCSSNLFSSDRNESPILLMVAQNGANCRFLSRECCSPFEKVLTV